MFRPRTPSNAPKGMLSAKAASGLWRRSYWALLLIAVALAAYLFFPQSYSAGRSKVKPLPYDDAAAASGEYKYAVVFDAGSTGSRVHTYKFKAGAGAATLDLISDDYHHVKPGLSSFADKPKDATTSLEPLMKAALEAVPASLHAQTPVELRATAGLRLLPGGKADAILDAVREYLRAQPFKFEDDMVSVLDGMDEGAYAWVSLNYLLGRLGKGPEELAASIDMGGGSMQMAYAVSDGDADSAPPGYVSKLSGGGVTYNVYVHSYLGYGLMAGRAGVLAVSDKAAGHPCMPHGPIPEYEYAGETYDVAPATDGPSAEACSKAAVQSLKVGETCEARSTSECSFNGAWGGPGLGRRDVYAASYLFDRAIDVGIVGADATLAKITPSMYEDMAEKACHEDDAGTVKGLFRNVRKDKDAQFLCLDLVFCHSVLTGGFGIPGDQEVTLARRIMYNGDDVEVTWTLGAAINTIGKV
ncbi:unnamed protein product [Pedinophyceae sp. YPF-701]|nr:unnamed protein product [Pedinophyceae sp. YPF-701]